MKRKNKIKSTVNNLDTSYLTILLNFTTIPTDPLLIAAKYMYTIFLKDFVDYCQLLFYHHQVFSVFQSNILDTFTQYYNHLYTIILIVSSALFHQIAMDCKIFRIVVIFEKSHLVLLEFHKGGLYLIINYCNITQVFLKI